MVFAMRSVVLPLDHQPYEVDVRTVDGVFVKQIVIERKGTVLPQHSHVWDHTSMIARGAVMVWKDGQPDDKYTAPCGIFIKACVKHTFLSLEDNTVIYCIHNLHGEDKIKILEEHELSGEV
jgi:quercetin dioxygenase-like cupin family protein